MANIEMLINVSEGEECRIALLEDGKLEELYMERTSSTSHVGNIYKGKVTNVEPSIQAAFVDFGLGRNGFLHISDLMPTYFGRKGEDIQESVGRKMSRRDRPPIQRCLRRGDEIIVQIIKEGIGTKGPTLSTYLSVPGRILVMMPGMGKFGVSRKIEDDDERRRLRTILDSLKPLKDVGFIIRTAGVGKSKTDIQRDLTYLTRLWQNIDKKIKSGPGPMELYTEGDLVTRTVRDVFSTDIGRIVIDNKDVAKRVKEVIKLANPRTKNKVELYEDPIPLFHKYGIEREIELMYSRHVPLPSGGSLVIDSTEAIVAIDVNSGKFRDHSDAETTAFKTDMEAADEIPRQLRLRDLGGVIICDFIDLRYERHRRDLEKRLHDNLRNDRAKTKVLRMSQFGIIEMTRQRMRPSLKRSIYFDCPHCKGSGLVKTPESMSLDVMRRLMIAIHDQRVLRVELTACPDVAFYLLNRKRQQLSELEAEVKKSVLVRSDPKLALDDIRLDLYDAREGLVFIEELGMSPFSQQQDDPRRRQQQPAGRRDNRQRGRGAGGGRRDQRDKRGGGGRGRPQEPDRDDEGDEDRFDIEGVEDAVDRREETREAADEQLRPERQIEVKSDEPSSIIVDDDSQPDDDDVPPTAPPAASRRGRRGGPPVIDDDAHDDGDDDNESSHVVDVDDPSEPMGEGPRAMEEQDQGSRRRRRRRGRRGRGGKGRGEHDGAADNAAKPAKPVPANKSSKSSKTDEFDDDPSPAPVSDEDDARDEYGETKEDRAAALRAGQVRKRGQGDSDADDGPGPGNARGPKPRGGGGGGGAADAGADEAGQHRRRRRRGGRRHRRRKNGGNGGENGGGNPQANGAADTNGELPSDDDDMLDAPRPIAGDELASGDRSDDVNRRDDRDDAGVESAPPRRSPPQRIPPPRASSGPRPEVPRTGSTDRHLMREDSVDTTQPPEPPRRPRSVRDLDAIPDDFDE